MNNNRSCVRKSTKVAAPRQPDIATEAAPTIVDERLDVFLGDLIARIDRWQYDGWLAPVGALLLGLQQEVARG